MRETDPKRAEQAESRFDHRMRLLREQAELEERTAPSAIKARRARAVNRKRNKVARASRKRNTG